MATVTASISLQSSDLSNNQLSLTNTSTLTKAGTLEGLDTLISATKTFTSTSTVDLVAVTGFTASAANKAYICNTGTSSTEYFTIAVESEEIGRLYGGDWMFIPWDANTDDDITITPSVATTMTAEYIIFS
tara:strand:+ start:1569 stop:1961 length:393 start_codon:yes stop_codon:yes gene_type:complete